MTFGAAIGFLLAWTLVAWLASFAGAGILEVARRFLGAAEQRVVATGALLVPPLLATAVMVSIALTPWLREDHCPQHSHHPHLCVLHGDWAEPAASALSIAVVLVAATTLASRLQSLLRTRRLVGRLRRHAKPHDGLRVIDSGDLVCFTAGIRKPDVFVSEGALRRLAPAAREAMLAHERAHAAGRDPAWQAALSLAAAIAPPFLGESSIRAWGRATERLRDAEAARLCGPIAVAEALVTMARSSRPELVSAFGTTGRELESRVRALLDERIESPSRPAWSWGAAGLSLIAIATIAGGLADPLHHGIETVLEVFVR